MKLKFNKITFNIEEIFLLITFIFLLSKKIRSILFSFYTCYLFILFHELSHIFVASLFGKKVNKLNFTLSGLNVNFYYNISKVKNNKYYIKEIIINLAGPISNIILCILFGYNKMIFEINMCLAIINMMPIYPLDGYNVLKNLLEILYLNNIIKKRNIIKLINNLFFIFMTISFVILFFIMKNISYLIFLLYIICYKMTSNIIKSNKNSINNIC